jgi:hypothetical protein
VFHFVTTRVIQSESAPIRGCLACKTRFLQTKNGKTTPNPCSVPNPCGVSVHRSDRCPFRSALPRFSPLPPVSNPPHIFASNGVRFAVDASLNCPSFLNPPSIYSLISLTPALSSPILIPMMTAIIKSESAFTRAIRGRPFVAFASFRSPIRVDQCSSVGKSRELHTTAQNLTVFAPMCTPVQFRASSCGKTKNFRIVHKPHITAHRNHFAPTCIKLHQLAEKKLRAEPQTIGERAANESSFYSTHPDLPGANRS